MSPALDESLLQALFGPEGRLRTGWKLLLFLLGNGVAGYVTLQLLPLAGWRLGYRAFLPTPWLLFLACLTVTWVFLRAEDRPLTSIGLSLDRSWARQFLAGSLGGIAIILVTAALGGALGGFHLVRSADTGLPQLLLGGWLFLAVALNEELLFRGYLFQRLEQGLGPWAAQACLALLFALSHWGNPGMAGATKVWATVNIALASLLLGLGYLRTRSLALPFGLHLGWNWAQGCLLGFGVSGTATRGWWTPVFHSQPEWLTGGSFGLEASLPCALICAFACAGLYVWKPRKGNG